MKPAPLTMGPSSEQACAGVLVTCDWLPVTSSPMWATFTTSTIVFIITTRRATITVSCSVYLMQSGQLISQATLRQEWILVWANFFANRTASDFNSISFINLHHSIVLCFLVSFFSVFANSSGCWLRLDYVYVYCCVCYHACLRNPRLMNK